MKLAIVAGESSGDMLAAGLVAALRARLGGELELIGVGGPALEKEGLRSLFDFSDIAIMGITAVLSGLPKLIGHLNRTSKAIITARPDVLVIVDSPGFTHRLAKRVRRALPDVPIVQYVSPTVWAWKEYRAKAMTPFVDHVLAILPFEPEVMQKLGGPPTTYVGHRLRDLPAMMETRAARKQPTKGDQGPEKTILLLPGSRKTEIDRLMPVFRETAEILSARGAYRFVMPTVPHQLERLRALAADWPMKPEILVGEDEKWAAFRGADAALAAAGTVLFELALATVPTVAVYKTDIVIRIIRSRIKTWSAALPNIVADYTVVPEYYDEMVRPGMLARWMEQLSHETPARTAMMIGYDDLFDKMSLALPASERAADIVLDLARKR